MAQMQRIRLPVSQRHHRYGGAVHWATNRVGLACAITHRQLAFAWKLSETCGRDGRGDEQEKQPRDQ